jgi:uncharacterized membrane protein YgaE (UPF0421/DUF939 family)
MEEAPAKTNSLQYVVAVLVMSMLGVIAVVAVTIIRPDKDNTTLIAAMIGFLTPTTMALLAFMKSQETHKAVNGRLDAFIKAATDLARSQGVDDEKKRAALETINKLHNEIADKP